MTDLTNIVVLRARVGKSEQLGAALSALVRATRSEPGCAVCELNQAADDADVWMVYERWRGQAAFDSHMQQPYVASFLAQSDDLLGGPVELRAFQFRG